jgi:hypothetical protein
MGLYQKMHQIMTETSGLEKTMTVGTGSNSYRAISEKAILNEIKPLLKKYGVIMFPIEAEIKEVVNTYTGYKGETSRLMSQVVVKYKIVDVESNEFEILATVGNGVDPQDKGSGKAWTYAYKALLQKTFMLFSGEDTDNEHSDDISDQMTAVPVKKISKEQAEVLYGVIKEKKKDDAESYIEKVIGYYGANTLNDLDIKQYGVVLNKLNGGA